MSGYTLTWHAEAVDDLIGLALALAASSIKSVQDNVPLLLGDPRPVTARRVGDLSDTWALPVGPVIVEYEIVADSVIRILGVRRRD